MTKEDITNKKPKLDSEVEEKEGIVNIYASEAEENGEVVDMTRLERAKKSYAKPIIIVSLIVIILASLSFLGYWPFTRDSGSSTALDNSRVALTLTSEEEDIASGDIITLELSYQNNEKVSLDSGELSIHYPDGFYYQNASVTPVSGTNNTWEFKDLSSGAGGKITITGQLVGEKNTQKSFSSLLSYRPSNFQQDFQEIANLDLMIEESLVDLDVTVPSRVQDGEEIEYKVKVKNTSQLPLPNVKAILDYPPSFEISKIKPEADQKDNVWLLDSLAAQEEVEFSMRGTISGESGENQEFKFQLGLLEPDGNFNLQVEKTSLLLIVNPDLKISLSAPENAGVGDELEYKVTLENTSDVTIKDLQVTLNFKGKNISQEQAVLDSIDSLGPHKEKKIKYTTSVKKKIEKDSSNITATAVITNAEIDGENVEFEQEAEAVTKIISEFKLSTIGRYYTEDLTKIGDGPLPPQVNQKTTYVIFWKLTGGTNDLENVTVQTTLPEEVIWDAQASDGVEYDSSSRQITWSLDSLKAEKNKEVQFSVSVIPVPDDLDKLLVLTEETVASANDVSADQNISQNKDRITTDLIEDEAAKDKGVVVGN